jgi:hypothetical protein
MATVVEDAPVVLVKEVCFVSFSIIKNICLTFEG